MMKKIYIFRFSFFSLYLIPLNFIFLSPCIAQLTVTQGGTAQAMATAIVGPGVIVSNATLNCPTASYGTFSGSSNIGLTNGILLTTGSVTQVPGPASNGFLDMNTLSFDNGAMGGDPNLTAIEPLATYNTCILEFDVIPICDTLQLSYVFASEEYPEYVCSDFNDVFGFFITGPNPSGGNYNALNIAVIPGTSIPVAINSINPGTAGSSSGGGTCTSLSYSSLYVNNNSGSTIAYDDFTVPLVASVPVTTCQTYHMKLAIADANDAIYDSGVFLEQSGLNCPGTSVNITALVDTAVEGCVNGSIQITRGGDLTSSLSVTLTFSGTASNGADYTLTNNVTFGTGQSTITLSIPAISDGNSEGTEIATITGSYNICGTSATTTPVNITITEGPLVSFSSVSPGCGNSNGSITATPNGGTAPYTYQWNTSPSQTTATATGLSAGNYTVTVTDFNNCSSDSTFNIGTTPSLNLTTSSTPVACNGGTNGTATVNTSAGTTPYSYQWNTTPIQTSSTATGLVAGNYSVTVSDNSGCQNTATIAVNSQTAVTLTTNSTDVTCAGGSDGTATVSPSGGNTPYSFLWSTGAGSQNIFSLQAGNYSVTVNDSNNCPSVTSVTVNDGAPNANATITPIGPFCDGDSPATLTAATGGGTYSGAGISGNSFSPSGAGAGTHIITYSISSACGDTDTVSIVVNPIPDATINPVSPLCIGDSPITLAAATAGGTWSGTGVSGNSFDPSISGTGTFTVSYSVTVSGCSSGDTETINVNQSLNADISPSGPFCETAPPVTLSAVSPGGSWSGNGITNPSGGVFDPFVSGAGTHFITYSISSACGDTDTVSIVVNPIPDATINPVSSLCSSDSPVALTSATSGGTWSGTGVSGNNFDPAISGVGTFTVTYLIIVSGCSSSDTESVTINQDLNAGISPAGPFCGVSSPVTLSAVSPGGTWSGNGITNSSSGTFDASVSGPGNHIITYSISSSCGDTDTVTISVSEVIIDSDTVINSSCFGNCDGSIALNATGATQFSIDNGLSFQSGNSFSNLCIGNYFCIVKNGLGCTDSVQLTVAQPPDLSLNNFLSSDATCYDSCNGYAVVIPAGGTSPYNYFWSPTGGSPPIGSGQTTASAGQLCFGTYNLLITDKNGCVKDKDFNINQPAQGFVVTTGTQTLCSGSCNGSATANAFGGAGSFSFQWDNNTGSQTTQIATGLCAGNYIVIATDANQCPVAASVVVSQPPPLTISLSADTTICVGTSTVVSVVNASGGTGQPVYLWDNGASGSFQVVNPSGATCYTVTATDGNGCQSPPQTSCVSFFDSLTVTAYSDMTICKGWSVELNAMAQGGDGSPYTYSWVIGGQQIQNITEYPPGDYPDTVFYPVIVNDGCSPPVTDSVMISFFKIDTVKFTPPSAFECAPYNATFTNLTPNPLSCLWDMGDGTFIDSCGPFEYTYSNPGSYLVDLTIFTMNGCSTTSSPPAFIIVNPNPIADFTYTPEAPTVVNTLVNFNNASMGQITMWEWTFFDINNSVLSNSQNINPEFTFPSDTGLYPVNLQVTTLNECTDDTTIYIYINNEYSLWIPNSFTPDGDGNNDFFPPKGIGINPERFVLYIFDRWGDLIFESHNLNDPWDGTARELGGNELVKEDVYVWKIVTEEATRERKEHRYVGHVTLLR